MWCWFYWHAKYKYEIRESSTHISVEGLARYAHAPERTVCEAVRVKPTEKYQPQALERARNMDCLWKAAGQA